MWPCSYLWHGEINLQFHRSKQKHFNAFVLNCYIVAHCLMFNILSSFWRYSSADWAQSLRRKPGKDLPATTIFSALPLRALSLVGNSVLCAMLQTVTDTQSARYARDVWAPLNINKHGFRVAIPIMQPTCSVARHGRSGEAANR